MLNFLKENRLFRGCNDAELETISEICDQRDYADGDTIFEGETPATHIYLLFDGRVEFSFDVAFHGVSRAITLGQLAPGAVFGRSALIKDGTYTLQARALVKSTVISIEGAKIQRLCAENDHLGHGVMKNLAELIGERFIALQTAFVAMVRSQLRDMEIRA